MMAFELFAEKYRRIHIRKTRLNEMLEYLYIRQQQFKFSKTNDHYSHT